MATSSTITPAPAPADLDNPSLETSDIDSRFDQMFARMRGTATILGDIVTSDPELWEDPSE